MTVSGRTVPVALLLATTGCYSYVNQIIRPTFRASEFAGAATKSPVHVLLCLTSEFRARKAIVDVPPVSRSEVHVGAGAADAFRLALGGVFARVTVRGAAPAFPLEDPSVAIVLVPRFVDASLFWGMEIEVASAVFDGDGRPLGEIVARGEAPRQTSGARGSPGVDYFEKARLAIRQVVDKTVPGVVALGGR